MTSRKRKLKSVANRQRPAGKLTELVSGAFGLEDGCPEKPFVVLKYYHSSWECFSAWQPDELKAFSDFCRRLGQMTWQQVYEQGGRGGRKTGLGYTKHDGNAKVPDLSFIESQLDPEINMFEMRVTKKARVHGFRAGDAFSLVLLDRDHRVYPE